MAADRTPDLQPATDDGRAGLATLLAEPTAALVAFDYDGTLAPIVDDPASARVQPGMVDALAALGERVGRVAIVTGRPAATAVRLGGFDEHSGLSGLVVLGQYGLERWSAVDGRLRSVEAVVGLDRVRRELPGLLAAAGVRDADIEDKGLAVAVHVRRSAEPAAAFARLLAPLRGLAADAGLTVEPGRLVIELRPAGMDKGKALLGLAQEADAGTVVFVGDDLGDLAAFDAVDAWRAGGGSGLLVCSGSDEVTALAERADLVVDGPPGVLDLVVGLTELLAVSQ